MKNQASRVLESLCIEFDGQCVSVESNDLSLIETMRDIYGMAVADRGGAAIASIKVFATGRGYRVETSEETADVIDTLDTLPDHLKHMVHARFVAARPDLLWLHSAAVEQGGSATLILGQSGAGKSTISTRLVDAGWRLLSDDVSPIERPSTVIPYYQLPSRRKTPGLRLADAEVRNMPRETVIVPSERIQKLRTPVVRNIFVKWDCFSIPEVVQLSDGDAVLSLLNHSVSFHRSHPRAIEKASELAGCTTSFALTYSTMSECLQLLRAVMDWN